MIERKEAEPGEVVLEIEGRLSGSIAMEFQTLLEEVVTQGYATVSLDLKKTTAIGSACIGRILLARTKLKNSNGVIQIKGCSDPVYESLTSLNLDKLISIEK